ncbi:hypothetical protein [Pseudonocardia charpentierae]|uniref:Uncharacterized protein n=1 Tax=Pseudonocardia charpentierae TaxID=3075545 RepID=A0ABU2NJ39_9PSEU|nr:hypothetical protein [Pseudonocardia sp. DSM 45834]MDT0353990.1 hypothetical protein [Pseudonocardia sp. DSM 45834]
MGWRLAWGVLALAAAQALAQAASIASNFPELPAVHQIVAGVVAVLLVFGVTIKMTPAVSGAKAPKKSSQE